MYDTFLFTFIHNLPHQLMVYGDKPNFNARSLRHLPRWFGIALIVFTCCSSCSPQLTCLSSVLRQLQVFPTSLNIFVSLLKERLGPQLHNVPLLYQGAPELRDVLAQFDIILDSPQEMLDTPELRTRFQILVENVFSLIAETRLFALFLDDIHEADES